MSKYDAFINETDWVVNTIFRRKKEFYKAHRMKYNLSFTNLNKMYNDLHTIHRTVHTDLNYILRANFNFNYGEAHTITTWFLVEKRIYMETTEKIMYLLLSLERLCKINYNWAKSMGRNGHLMRNVTRNISCYLY